MVKTILANEEREGEGNNLKFGISSVQNFGRKEDKNCVLLRLPKNGLENWSFMAVFDGHGGPDLSKYLAEELMNNILNADRELFDELAQNSINLKQETINERIKQAIKKAFLETDSFEGKIFKELTDGIRDLIKNLDNMKFPGSTAVACLISPTHIYLINCGDSRAILVSDNQIKIATIDHKTNNPLETERINNAGGRIAIGNNMIFGKNLKTNLKVSRSFGDYQFKSNLEKQPFEQIISAEPDIYIHDRSEKDEFIVLASDGIWDVINNEEIQQFINYRLKITQNLAEICKDINNVCIKRVYSLFF
jgi:serine/threonine protein phosphatase PrpC